MVKRKINLAKIAEQTEKNYKVVTLLINNEEYETKVYHVPQPVIWNYIPGKAAPELPSVLMRKDATGRRQRRAAKPGDEEWDEYTTLKAQHDKETDDLQWAARFVLALADIDYPDLTQPPKLLAKNGVSYPDNEILKKKLWLDYTLFTNPDNYATVQLALTELSGYSEIDESLVGGAKKNSESITEEEQ